MPTITVAGTSCAHCERTVEEALRELSCETDVAALVRAVEYAGYEAHA